MTAGTLAVDPVQPTIPAHKPTTPAREGNAQVTETPESSRGNTVPMSLPNTNLDNTVTAAPTIPHLILKP